MSFLISLSSKVFDIQRRINCLPRRIFADQVFNEFLIIMIWIVIFKFFRNIFKGDRISFQRNVHILKI